MKRSLYRTRSLCAHKQRCEEGRVHTFCHVFTSYAKSVSVVALMPRAFRHRALLGDRLPLVQHMSHNNDCIMLDASVLASIFCGCYISTGAQTFQSLRAVLLFNIVEQASPHHTEKGNRSGRRAQSQRASPAVQDRDSSSMHCFASGNTLWKQPKRLLMPMRLELAPEHAQQE